MHYTFDKDNKINCLARAPQTLQVQTIPIDDRNSIGVVDLRVCLRAVTECSPELAGQEGDYTIYAVDYSEPDTPLVGQGMLSWALETINNDWTGQSPKMVTGRVTQNLLAVFGGGNRETLEVKLKLTAAAKVQRPEPQLTIDVQPMRPMEQAMTPTGASEWNSFLQSNPQLGHSAHVSRVASPALSHGHPPPMNLDRRDSFGPSQQIQEVQRVAPIPIDPTSLPPQQGPSRPSSRSSRKKGPTGRPRGRPRKKPAEGHTSGYEDGTEGEDGPVKKRAKITKAKASKAAVNPFNAGPESLRVAASTSGSLRNFRPVANNDSVSGSHLQEVPRAPTPVPDGGPMAIPPRAQNGSKLRRESTLSQDFSANHSSRSPQKPLRALSPSQEDGRSPESGAPTPNYSEDSPQDIGSSPPVEATPYMRSSPPPSSPVLPPMHQPQLPMDASFMSTDTDCLFDELPAPHTQERNLASSPAKRRPIEAIDSTGVPTQVFRLKHGPDGREIIHIRNLNTQRAPYVPLAPVPQVEAPSLPPLKKDPPVQARKGRSTAQKGAKRPPPPTLAPTPPPTTDTIEKFPSPVPEAVPEISPEVASPIAEAIPEVTPEAPEPVQAVKEESPFEPTPITEEQALLSLQEAFPLPDFEARPPQPKKNRQFNRSQSTSALALPASEPLGPSSLSQSTTAEPARRIEAPSTLRRSNSIGPLCLPIPASDPIGPPQTTIHLPTPSFSEAPCPPSDAIPTPSSPQMRSNKNLVKKQSIKQRLEKAIQAGEMPPFCANCGSINTPTWRKIWIQDHEGVPQYVEYSERPGKITAIDILRRDEEDKPLAYRLIKKSLANEDDKTAWIEQLLCNPCGIWLTKYRSQRPQDKWDNTFGPLGQDRKRGAPANAPRSKKARTKSTSQLAPVTEGALWTDPVGPLPSSPKFSESQRTQPNSRPGSEEARDSGMSSGTTASGSNEDTEMRSNPGSTHSRGSGTARSPIAIDMDLDVDLGSTRRLLFPSPKKDGQSRVLGEVNANIVPTTECRQNKELVAEKENVAVTHGGNGSEEHDDLEALFGSPAVARPSTPPPKAKAAGSHSGPFKTPTRPTPNHRPITRSVSRSLRSIRGMTSPAQQALLQRTPTKTPRGTRGAPGSASVRRSPRNHQMSFGAVFDTPISRAISQVLSEPNFDLINSDFDISGLPTLDTNHGTIYDFGNLLSTDPAGMPSSPPKDSLAGFDFSASADVWTQWGISTEVMVEENDETRMD